MKEHPTQSKDRLMNKMLANMMMSCADKITLEQRDELQEFKDQPYNYDHSKGVHLLDFDINVYAADPSDPTAAMVELNSMEANM